MKYSLVCNCSSQEFKKEYPLGAAYICEQCGRAIAFKQVAGFLEQTPASVTLRTSPQGRKLSKALKNTKLRRSLYRLISSGMVSQKGMAEEAKMSASHLSRIMCGRNNPGALIEDALWAAIGRIGKKVHKEILKALQDDKGV